MSSGADEDRKKRFLIFGLCILVGLASGSNYVYSAYAPQLGTELHISSTTVNMIGLAGNLGVYSSGPLWGKIVDSRGQRIPLLLGGTFTLLGYSTIRLYLLHTLTVRSPSAPLSSPISLLRLTPLLLSMFLTGAAGSAGLSSAINATAKSFPDAQRASATGAVLAGFGLSAFFFSTLGHLVYGGDAAGLLGLLAVGTGVPMILGGIFIRAIPPTPRQEGYDRLPGHPEIVFENSSPRRSLDYAHGRISITSREASPSLELIRSRSPHPPTHTSPHSRSSRHSSPSASSRLNSQKGSGAGYNYTPRELLFVPTFHLLALVLAILCGTGLMYINNVGTVALVLARQGRQAYDRKEVNGWQSRNVGLISIWNCLGRIIGGVASDVWKARYNGERVWLLPIVASLFILSQLSALSTTHVESLWIVSTLLGGAYGCLFNVVPMLVLEWFGMAHFSQNFGWLCLSPVIGGNLFNLIFGKIYDSNSIGHVEEDHDNTRRDIVSRMLSLFPRASNGNGSGAHECLLGVPCYARAFHISLFGCFIALGISIYLGRGRAEQERERALLEREEHHNQLFKSSQAEEELGLIEERR